MPQVDAETTAFERLRLVVAQDEKFSDPLQNQT